MGAERRRDTIEFMMKEGWSKVMGDIPHPEMRGVMDFLDKEGKFATASVWIGPDCIPSVFWALYKDSDMSPFASVVAQLPTSSASVERLWSSMSFAAEGAPNP